MNKRVKKAFTLIELLVVIAIVGILSGLIVVSMNGMTQKATIAKSKMFSSSLRNALMSNLITEWKLDETSGTSANDSWSGGHSGTLTNFSFDTTDGWRSGSYCVSDGCLQFDGTDDYITATTSPQITTYTQPVTIEAWANVPSSYSWSLIAEIASLRTTSWGAGIFLNSTNNLVTFVARIGGSTYGSKYYSISRDTWYHLVFTGDGSVFDAYANGVKITTSSLAYGTASGSDYTGVFTVGSNRRYADSSGQYFGGYIDGVRLYGSVIPTSQIEEQYYAGLNKLLANGGISIDEYRERIGEVAIRP
jgi:prepilin-type N-terminal cleavage/methylation domain-containing protein